jgi:predicted metal-binding protein
MVEYVLIMAENIENAQSDLIVRVKPVINPRVRGYCRLPYPGHPRGCPNYNKRAICPPQAPLLDKLIDIGKPVYCIVNQFDLREHAERMRDRHPDWSEAQLYCCLYWQGRGRKQLRRKVDRFLETHPGYLALYCPEGSGVDVVATVGGFGLKFEWPARRYAYQVALAGVGLS